MGGNEKEIVLGGVTYVQINESTVEHDLHFTKLVRRASIDSTVMEDGEAPSRFARRVLDAALVQGDVLEILGCILIPKDLVEEGQEPGDFWTPEIARRTREQLGKVRATRDKIDVEGLVLELLIRFFEAGVVSFEAMRTASLRNGTEKAPELTPETANAGAPGPS